MAGNHAIISCSLKIGANGSNSSNHAIIWTTPQIPIGYYTNIIQFQCYPIGYTTPIIGYDRIPSDNIGYHWITHSNPIPQTPSPSQLAGRPSPLDWSQARAVDVTPVRLYCPGCLLRAEGGTAWPDKFTKSQWHSSVTWIWPLICIDYVLILDISCLYSLGLNLPEEYSCGPRPWVAASWCASDQCVTCSFSVLVTVRKGTGNMWHLRSTLKGRKGGRLVQQTSFFHCFRLDFGLPRSLKIKSYVEKCGVSMAAPRHLTIKSKKKRFKDMVCHCHCPSRPWYWAKISNC